MSAAAFSIGGEPFSAQMHLAPDGTVSVKLAPQAEPVVVSLELLDGGAFRVRLGEETAIAHLGAAKEGVFLLVDGAGYLVAPQTAAARTGAAGASGNRAIAPMPGIIRKVLVAPGESVVRNQPLVIMEAMKMELVVASPRDGAVEAVLAEAGKTVEADAELVRLK